MVAQVVLSSHWSTRPRPRFDCYIIYFRVFQVFFYNSSVLLQDAASAVCDQMYNRFFCSGIWRATPPPVLLPIKDNRSDYLTVATFNNVTNDTENLRENNRSVSLINFPPFFLFIFMFSFGRKPLRPRLVKEQSKWRIKR